MDGPNFEAQMKVKILQAMRGPALAHNPGDVIDLDDEAAKRLISKGIAAPMKRGRPKKADMPEPEAR